MTSDELRARLAWSGISRRRLAGLLGVPRPNVSGWCSGTRPIPARHIPEVMRVTGTVYQRTEPAWRPPADMPPGRSSGYHSKVSRQRRAARAERQEPLQRSAQPVRSATIKRTDRPPKPHREPLAPRLDLSGLSDLLMKLAVPQNGGNGSSGAAGTARAMMRPAASIPLPQWGPPATSQPAAPRQVEPPSMAGPRHETFVAQENKRLQPDLPGTVRVPLFWFLRSGGR